MAVCRERETDEFVWMLWSLPLIRHTVSRISNVAAVPNEEEIDLDDAESEEPSTQQSDSIKDETLEANPEEIDLDAAGKDGTDTGMFSAPPGLDNMQPVDGLEDSQPPKRAKGLSAILASLTPKA